jgi:hypothetical protein
MAYVYPLSLPTAQYDAASRELRGLDFPERGYMDRTDLEDSIKYGSAIIDVARFYLGYTRGRLIELMAWTHQGEDQAYNHSFFHDDENNLNSRKRLLFGVSSNHDYTAGTLAVVDPSAEERATLENKTVDEFCILDEGFTVLSGSFKHLNTLQAMNQSALVIESDDLHTPPLLLPNTARALIVIDF